MSPAIHCADCALDRSVVGHSSWSCRRTNSGLVGGERRVSVVNPGSIPPGFTIFSSALSPGAKCKWCRCGGSIEPISIERDAFGQEQLLEALLLIERRLHPQVRRTR